MFPIKKDSFKNRIIKECFDMHLRDNYSLWQLDKNGNYKIISFYAKKARGLMARFIIQNRIKKTDELVNFDLDGYKYSKADSTAESPVFLRKS